MTRDPDDDIPPVVDVDPSFCEDGRTLHVWYVLADGRMALSTFEFGGALGQDQTPHIIAGAGSA